MGTNAEPVFDDAILIESNSTVIDVGYSACPSMVDWNRDGKKDLLVGKNDGGIAYFQNEGTQTAPLFTGASPLMVGSTPLSMGSGAYPVMVDWDGDEVLDIIAGNNLWFVYYFHALGPLSLSENRINESIGNEIELTLNAGSIHGGRKYIIFGSISGTYPGFTLPGGLATLPLNWDIFTDLVFILLNTAVFNHFFGFLDSGGEATARFNTLGPVPGAAGTYIHFAYALNNPWDYISNPAAIEVVP